MSDTAAYVNAGAQVAGATINSISTTAQGKQSYKYQKKLMDRAYRRNLEMWNTQNAYNAPSAQIQRLEEAGLNPNLIYGHGSVANTADTPPQLDSPGLRPYVQQDFGIGDAVDAFFRTRQAESSIQNMVEQNSNLRTQNSLIAAQAAKTLIESGLLEEDKKVRSELNRYSVQAAQMSVRNLEKDLDVKQQNINESMTRITELQSKIGLNNQMALRVNKEIDSIATEIAYKQMMTAKGWQSYKFDSETFDDRKKAISDGLVKLTEEINNLKKSGNLTTANIEKLVRTNYSGGIAGQVWSSLAGLVELFTGNNEFYSGSHE